MYRHPFPRRLHGPACLGLALMWPVACVWAAEVVEPVRDCLQRDAEGRFVGWLDSQHCLLSNRATASAQWLDGLFGDWHGPEDARARVRTVVHQHWDEAYGLHTGFSLRASTDLPNARQRFRLVVSDEEDLLKTDEESLDRPSNFSAAIRWLPDYVSRVRYTFDLGLHSTPELYARAKAYRRWRIGHNALMHFTETLRYGAQDKGRALSQLDLERATGGNSVFRWSNSLLYREAETEPVGLRWAQDWVVLHRIGDRRSLSWGAGLEGVQQPEWSLSRKGLFVLYRQSFWRPWVYYELEPHLDRRRDLDWKSNPSLTVRLEAQFGQ